MNKKTIIIILLILLLIVGLIGYFELFVPKEIKIGDTAFYLPNGYHENGQNTVGDVSFSNGTNSIYVAELNSSYINQHIDSYVKYNNESNNTVRISNFTIDDMIIYKSNLTNDTNNVHYWFVINNCTYMVYTWDGNKKMDSMVYDFIKSAH